MIEIVDKGFLKKRVNVWFPENGYVTKQRCDVCCYIGIQKLHSSNNQHIKFNSLISDLTLSKEELFNSFKKATRYDIRRSERDEISIIHYNSRQLNEDLYSSYKTIYEKMYKSKGLLQEAPIDDMARFAANDALVISSVNINKTPVVYHVYIVVGKHARLWMSCSAFRDNDDKQYREMLGRANKRLHFEDIIYFIDNGYTSYDWGGICSYEVPTGIDLFKMSFGGEPITYYDETIIMSLKYKVFHFIKKSIRKLIRADDFD